MSGIVVNARLAKNSSAVRLAVDTISSFPSPTYSSSTASANGFVRLTLTGLAADTRYFYALEVDGVLMRRKIGRFKTMPSGSNVSFMCAFSGDASLGSTSKVFATIKNKDPLFFFHLGDLHYENIVLNRTQSFTDAYYRTFQSHAQEKLYREVPTYYMWDDHDYGDNNSFSTSPSKNAALTTYRRRVPHPTLENSGTTDPIYFKFEIGRVMFIVTDLRSQASDRAATDNSSKTMMGATQKTWFKGLMSDAGNDGKFFVWICSRCWGGVATAGADHWGGFTTERTELANHMLAECPGRIAVISADMHSLAIDSGANHEFANPGSMPVPTFQAAPLDRTGNETYGGATYDQGAGRYTGQGQFGTMEITDSGGSTITIDWTGYDIDGSQLVTYQLTPTL